VHSKKGKTGIGYWVYECVAQLASGLAKYIVLSSKGNDAPFRSVSKFASDAVRVKPRAVDYIASVNQIEGAG
jgi:hypothetical protein